MNIEVNYLAVVAAAVAYMAIGFVWYGPLFGKMWMRLMGWDPNDKAKKEEMKKGMPKIMGLSAISALITAFVIAHVVKMIGASTIVDAVQFGFWAWLGFVATTTLAGVLYEKRSKEVYFLNNGYVLVSFVVMAIILVMWQ